MNAAIDRIAHTAAQQASSCLPGMAQYEREINAQNQSDS